MMMILIMRMNRPMKVGVSRGLARLVAALFHCDLHLIGDRGHETWSYSNISHAQPAVTPDAAAAGTVTVVRTRPLEIRLTLDKKIGVYSSTVLTSMPPIFEYLRTWRAQALPLNPTSLTTTIATTATIPALTAASVTSNSINSTTEVNPGTSIVNDNEMNGNDNSTSNDSSAASVTQSTSNSGNIAAATTATAAGNGNDDGNTSSGRRVCEFFHTPRGCIKGNNCDFLHAPLCTYFRSPRGCMRVNLQYMYHTIPFHSTSWW
jgi:hypothetical protein